MSPVTTLKMAVTSFNYNYNPEKEIKDALGGMDIKSPGKKILLIGHSWGGHAVQNFMNKYKEGSFEDWHIMGGVLLGSSIQRHLITVQKDGSSFVDMGPNSTPIMIFGAEMDGLNRISRFAESFYHTSINIDPIQQNKFYNLMIDGINHASFANFSMEQPVYIKKNDLICEESPWGKLDEIVQLIAIRMKEE